MRDIGVLHLFCTQPIPKSATNFPGVWLADLLWAPKRQFRRCPDNCSCLTGGV